MAKDRNGSAREEERGVRADEEEPEEEELSKRERHQKAKRRKEGSNGVSSGDSDSEKARGKKRKSKVKRSRGSRRRDTDSESEDESSYSDTYSETDADSKGDSESDSGSESEKEELLRRKKRKERRRKEREQEKERRRRKEKERERRKKREKEERRRRKERKKEKKKKEKDRGTKGAVTNSWGKYGVIKETDMWNKRPEFTAWLAEVKQVNLETLPNWEEKQMFKQFMEDHNTATFPSKKYYNLDAYHRRKMDNVQKKSLKEVLVTERTNFNDEEQRRQELLVERERMKEEKVEELKRSMQSGMAQAMKEQARLREEMAYQYKLGNFEAAAAIQKRLDPDVAM
ncbi:hypothetical protein M5K25_016153 [Dendrobium thyrsiflorum]|uniref:Uncharacterized protein n=1 Tax=Dendrobium thyrsiflorum TaxID=117978 RepID=A0ABD0UJT3_DENTH